MNTLTRSAQLLLIENLVKNASNPGTIYHGDADALWNLEEAVTTAVFNNPSVWQFKIVRNSMDLFSDQEGVTAKILAYGNYPMSLVGHELRLLVELL